MADLWKKAACIPTPIRREIYLYWHIYIFAKLQTPTSRDSESLTSSCPPQSYKRFGRFKIYHVGGHWVQSPGNFGLKTAPLKQNSAPKGRVAFGSASEMKGFFYLNLLYMDVYMLYSYECEPQTRLLTQLFPIAANWSYMEMCYIEWMNECKLI